MLMLSLLAYAVAVIQPAEAQRLCKCTYIVCVSIRTSIFWANLIWIPLFPTVTVGFAGVRPYEHFESNSVNLTVQITSNAAMENVTVRIPILATPNISCIRKLTLSTIFAIRIYNIDRILLFSLYIYACLQLKLTSWCLLQILPIIMFLLQSHVMMKLKIDDNAAFYAYWYLNFLTWKSFMMEEMLLCSIMIVQRNVSFELFLADVSKQIW